MLNAKKNKFEILTSIHFNMADNYVSKYVNSTVVKNSYNDLQNYIFDTSDENFNDFFLSNCYLDTNNVNDVQSISNFLNNEAYISDQYRYLEKYANEIKLNLPNKSNLSKKYFQQVIKERKTSYQFKKEKLSFETLSHFLYYSFGVNLERKTKKYYASAGALYAVNIFFYANNVENIDDGFYEYDCWNHSIIKKSPQEKDLLLKINSDNVIKTTFFNLIIFYVLNTFKNKFKYTNASSRFGLIETGAAMHNADLHCAWLNLKSHHIGKYNTNYISDKLKIKDYFGMYVVNVSLIGY